DAPQVVTLDEHLVVVVLGTPQSRLMRADLRLYGLDPGVVPLRDHVGQVRHGQTSPGDLQHPVIDLVSGTHELGVRAAVALRVGDDGLVTQATEVETGPEVLTCCRSGAVRDPLRLVEPLLDAPPGVRLDDRRPLAEDGLPGRVTEDRGVPAAPLVPRSVAAVGGDGV